VDVQRTDRPPRLPQEDRDGSTPNSHPATKRTCVFRAGPCARAGSTCSAQNTASSRTTGATPRRNNRGRLDKFPDHPKAFYSTEESLLDAVAAFYVDRVFDPHRRDILTAELGNVDDRAAEQRQAEHDALRRQGRTRRRTAQPQSHRKDGWGL